MLVFQYLGTTYISPSPNPYTSTLSTTLTAASTPVSTGTATVAFQKAQTFQIISSGADGLYGVGGQYIPLSADSTAATQLPVDPNGNTYESGSAITTGQVRNVERDNLTNFNGGTLQ